MTDGLQFVARTLPSPDRRLAGVLFFVNISNVSALESRQLARRRSHRSVEDRVGMRLFITRKGSPIICRMLPVSLFLSLSYKYIPTALVRLVVHSCLVRTNSVRNASTDRVLQRTCDQLKKMRWTSVEHTLYCVPLTI